MVHDLPAARVLPLLVALLLLAPAPPSAPAAGCPAGRGACLTLTVPLDRSGAVPGTVALRAARIRSRRATRPPLVALTGGPGQAGVVFARDLADVLPTPGRDLVVLDQRGTGMSGLLRCPAFERRLQRTPSASAGDCGRLLGPRRALHTSADSAEDVESLRVRLGAERLALYGVSYGTRVALEYARRHPERVERLVLDSPVPIGSPDPFVRETLAAVPRVLRRTCSYGCRGAEAHPVADVRRMAARLRRAPIRRRVERRGRRVPVRVDADDLLSLLVSGDQLPSFLQEVPAAVRAALRGRTGQLARMKLEALEIESPGPIREFSPALFAATICEEAPVAWDRAAPPAVRRAQALQALAPVPPAAFGPFDRAAAIEAGTLPLCADWPAPIRPPAPDLPLPRGLPALVLSGELDLRTPLESARALAAALPARLVVERGVGHSVLGADPAGCAGPATAAFLAGTELPGCDGPG